MKNKSNLKKFIAIALVGLFIYGFFLALEKNKIQRLEQSIINFQNEYKGILDQEQSLRSDVLDKLLDNNLFNSDAITKYYEGIKEETLETYDKSYESEINIFKFLKTENITNFKKDNKATYDKLVTSNNELVAQLEKSNDVDVLYKLKENNLKLKGIVVSELQVSSAAAEDFKAAKTNQGTTTILENDCFENQVNYSWQLDKDISGKFCLALGLTNCLSEITNSRFIGYSLNNPKTVNKKSVYVDYVSYRADDFRLEYAELLKNYLDNNNVYSEVYVKDVQGRKIYKYNVVIIAKDYKLSCKIPK